MAKLSQISSKNKWLADRTQGRGGQIAGFMENTVSPQPPPQMLVYQKKIELEALDKILLTSPKIKSLCATRKADSRKCLLAKNK